MDRTISPMKMSQTGMMIDYFLSADDDFLRGMGADPSKLPSATDWHRILEEDFARPIKSKQFYYIVWEADGVPIGHSNINKIVFGQEAFVHLHIWQLQHRRLASNSERNTTSRSSSRVGTGQNTSWEQTKARVDDRYHTRRRTACRVSI